MIPTGLGEPTGVKWLTSPAVVIRPIESDEMLVNHKRRRVRR